MTAYMPKQPITGSIRQGFYLDYIVEPSTRERAISILGDYPPTPERLRVGHCRSLP